MAEMRRPMDFWKGLVRPFYHRPVPKTDRQRYFTFEGLGTNSHFHCLRAIRLLRLRTS